MFVMAFEAGLAGVEIHGLWVPFGVGHFEELERDHEQEESDDRRSGCVRGAGDYDDGK